MNKKQIYKSYFTKRILETQLFFSNNNLIIWKIFIYINYKIINEQLIFKNTVRGKQILNKKNIT